MKCVGTAVGKTLPTVERDVLAKVNKALEEKVNNAKEAMEFFAKHPKEVYTPTYTSPAGTRVYYERGDVGVIKNVLKTDGTKIDAHFLGDGPRALTVFEKTKTGSEIMHTFPPNIKTGGLKLERGSCLTTPSGNMYGFNIRNGKKEYYQYTKNGWEKVEASQKDLEDMYKLHTYIARNGYPKANL